MNFNLGTTVSFSSAATCLALAALDAYLGRSAASRHFRYAAAAALAGAIVCVTNAIVAGEMSVAAAVWAGRVTLFAVTVHGAAWLAFLAAWDRRRLSRIERGVLVASLLGGLAALVPDVAVLGTVAVRRLAWAGFAYRDPDTGPFAVPILALAYMEQVLAARAAFRMARRNPRARVVAFALTVFCVVMPLDVLSGLHLLPLPYLSDPFFALIFISIGSVVMLDAAESAAKSAELERARVALAERENLAALGQLAAVVAHEVRNPVAIVFGAVAALQRTERTEDDAKLLAIVKEEAERLKLLVTRLLDAVRPFELQYSRRPAHALVRASIAQATSGAEAAPEQVVLESTSGGEVDCDEILLGQAISNLVQNALVASGRRSPVRVRATMEPHEAPTTLRVEVTDDGDGVALDVRPRLFTPFFTTRATGTGLGLALVKRIVGAHGGTVDFEPSPGRGATFLLRVPLRAGDVTPKRLLGGELR